MKPSHNEIMFRHNCKPEHLSGRWEHLIEITFQLSEELDLLESGEEAAGRDEKLAKARECLDDLIEVFGPEIDPIDDLNSYALRRLAVVLRRVLT